MIFNMPSEKPQTNAGRETVSWHVSLAVWDTRHGSGRSPAQKALANGKDMEKMWADALAEHHNSTKKKPETGRNDGRARNPRAVLHRWHSENSDGRRTGRGILSTERSVQETRERPERGAEGTEKRDI